MQIRNRFIALTTTNNTISGNGGFGIYCYSSSPSINYNCVWGNSTNYSNCSLGTGNISDDPQFIGNGDYHLQSASPCIDKGSNTAPSIPSTDKDGNPRILNGTVDMGAYEFFQPRSITGTISYSGTKTGILHYSAFTNSQFTGTPIAKGTETVGSPGTISYMLNVPVGTYYVRAYIDVDGNMSPSEDEPIGIYGSLSAVYYPWQIVGTATEVNVIGTSTSGIDFELSHEVRASKITGAISYTGTKTGSLYYSEFTNSQFTGTPIAKGTETVGSPGNISYMLKLPVGTYYVRAYIDVDGNMSPSEYDPIGIYGSLSAAYCYPYWQIIGTPTPVYATITSGIDFELSHELINTLAEAVDNTELIWRTGGNANWFKQTASDFSYYGGDVAQSDYIGDSQQSYIQTTVTDAGFLTFYWKVSSEGGADYLRFKIDGIEQSKISGEAGWTPQMSYFIPLGTHTLQWVYEKNSSGSFGKDCGWLDKVEFSSGNKISGVISYSGTKTGSLYYLAFDNPQFTGTPITGEVRTFSGPGTVSYTLAAPAGTYYLKVYIDTDNNQTPTVGDPIGIYGSLSAVYYPYQLIGTPTSVNVFNGITTSGIDFVLSCEVEEKVLLLDAIDVVDNPEFTMWETGGGNTALWFGQTDYSKYDGDAAQSGYIGNNQKTYIQTTVLGTWTLNFSWKVSSQSLADYLRFYIDGRETTAISGDVDWTQKSYFIPAGTHTLEWEYRKDSSGDSGSDCGWLDKVEFIPWGIITGAILYTGTKSGALHYGAVTDIWSPFGSGGGGGGIVELLTGQSESSWGSSADPFNTNDHDSRAQSVYLASELTAAGMKAGKITTLQLKCYKGPGNSNLKNFRIRIKQTSAITSTAWETTGWTTVFGPTNIIPTKGQWFDFVLSAPFEWDGVSNLLIDLSRDDTAYASGGGMYVRTGLSNRTYAGSSDSNYTWPFDSMSGSVCNYVPSLRVNNIPSVVVTTTTEFSGPCNINYALEVPPGTYYVRAYLDVCHDGGPTEYDPIGIYGSLSAVYYPWQIVGTATAVNVGSRATTSNIDVALSHKVKVKGLLGEAVDNTELVWTTSGAANWLPDYSIYHTSPASARSDKIINNQETYIQTEVTGTGTLRFHWKVSSQSGYDYLRFYIDGNKQDEISGESGWTPQMSYTLSAGTHTLKWEYKKDSWGSSGSDCGWLDKVEFIPWGRITGVISYTGTKTGSLYYSAFDNPQFTGTSKAHGIATCGSGTVGYALDLFPGTYFVRAYIDADNDKSPSVGDPVGIYGSLSLAYCHPWQIIGTATAVNVYTGTPTTGVDFALSQGVKDFLGVAVDNTELIWTTDGDKEWFGQYSNDGYGSNTARSGAIENSGKTNIQSTVTCFYPGTLRFYWKVSSQSGDYLRFYIDGNETDAIRGNVGWTPMSYVIPAGTHTLKWKYEKDSSGYSGSDCGWLDKVEFIPYGRITGVISYAGTKTGILHYSAFDNPQFIGTPIKEDAAEVSGSGTVNYSLSVGSGKYYIMAYLDADNNINPTGHDPVGMYGNLSTAYSHPWQIIGTATEVNVYSGSDTVGIDITLTHEVRDLLGEAVDNTKLIWKTSSNNSWFRQTDPDYSYYDGDAAQSGKT